MRRLEIKNSGIVRQQILKHLNSDEQAKYFMRLHAILTLIEQEKPNCSEIANLYGIAPPTVARWVNRINASTDGDITVLMDIPNPGRNTRMEEKQLAVISKTLARSPAKAGMKEDKWTGRLLSHYLKQKYNIALKVRMCQRWIRKFEEEKM